MGPLTRGAGESAVVASASLQGTCGLGEGQAVNAAARVSRLRGSG